MRLGKGRIMDLIREMQEESLEALAEIVGEDLERCDREGRLDEILALAGLERRDVYKLLALALLARLKADDLAAAIVERCGVGEEDEEEG